MNRSYILLFFFFQSFFLQAQTFTSPGDSIPDNNTYQTYSITVSGLSPSAINTSNFGLEKAGIIITHPNTADLEILLVSPDSTTVTLASYTGGTGNNFQNTFFADTANHSINNASAPFTGYFKPAQAINAMNNSQNGNGVW